MPVLFRFFRFLWLPAAFVDSANRTTKRDRLAQGSMISYVKERTQ